MKWIYLTAGVAIFLKLLLLPLFIGDGTELAIADRAIVETIVSEAGAPNAVSGIIFRNRLYDTIFEVVVFTIAIMGVKFLLDDEQPSCRIYQFTDPPSIVLARLGATIAALVCIELGIRGHLSPGGGFAAGVAGGTAIGLVAITASTQWMEAIYERYRAAIWEKISVVMIILCAVLSLGGIALPHGELGSLLSGGWIPLLNLLVALKVALGSWAAILLFIRYRGLL
jgi:multicomponent Na+:H+ antiporter subunit B